MSDRIVLGIDLGTTYTCVAHIDATGAAATIPNARGAHTTPSVVLFDDAGGVVVGQVAKESLRERPERVVQQVKRVMGVPGFSVEFDGRSYYPAQVSALVLESVVRDALAALGVDRPAQGPVADVVITVPAYFGDAERAATYEAGEIAGLNVVGILNEPTAAAIALGLTRSPTLRTVLVYDLGGGTFDATVVEVSDDIVREIATSGSRELGGADWDDTVRTAVLARYRDQHPGAPDPTLDEEAMGALDLLVEDVKKGLSTAYRYRGTFTAHSATAQVELTREEFESATADLVERTLGYIALVLDAAEEKGLLGLDDVVCVGGMSRVPSVTAALHERLRGRFAAPPRPRVVEPDHLVAKGAALFAAATVSGPGRVGRPATDGGMLRPPAPPLVTVTSRGYGIRAVDGEHDEVGHVSWIILPQAELPAVHSQAYRPIHAEQTSVEVEVFESATNLLNDSVDLNPRIVSGVLTGLAPGEPVRRRVDVTLTLGTDGLLTVRALGPHGEELMREWRRPGSVPPEERGRPLPPPAV